MSVTILHVEDSEVDHELFQRILAGVNITWVKTTKEASDYLFTVSGDDLPTIIVLDLNLPAENGIELIRRLKASEKYEHIPVIVLSSITDQAEIDACYLKGANAFIQKTHRSQELTVKLHSFKEFWLHTIELPHKKEKP